MKRTYMIVIIWAVTFIFTALPSFAVATGLKVTLDAVSPSSLVEGSSFTVSATVHNTSGTQLTGITVELQTLAMHTNAPQYIHQLEPGESERVTLFGTADSVGNHIVKVVAKHNSSSYPSGEASIRGSANENPVDEPTTAKAPLFSVSGVKFTPAKPNLSEPFTVEFEVTNRGNSEAVNTFVSFNGGENFEVVDLTSRVSVGTVWSGSKRTATFRIRAKKDRVSNLADLQFTYDNGNVRETFTERVNLPVGDVKGQQQKQPPFLKINTFSVEPQQINGDFMLRFTVRNNGGSAARNISIRLDESEAFPRGVSNVLFLPSLEAGAVREYSVKMAVVSKDKTVYTIPVQFDYADADNDSYQAAEILSVRATAIGIQEKQEEPGWRPRVMLSKYTLSTAQILAGDTVLLTLYIKNNSNQQVGNIKFSLLQIPSGNNASDTVFSPVNSSNSGYIETIGPRRTIAKSLHLYVDPNAPAKTYSVPVEIEYDDLSGNAYQVSETINIPVTQESRFQLLSLDVPQFAAVGQPIPISAEFVNAGKVALKNFVVRIEGDFQKENASYYLASFEIGASDYFQGMIIPESEGVLSGKVIFTYTDNTNKEVTVEEPFEIIVEQMDMGGPDGPYPPDYNPHEEPRVGFWSRMRWPMTGLILLLAVGGVFFARKMRAKRGDVFDEDL